VTLSFRADQQINNMSLPSLKRRDGEKGVDVLHLGRNFVSDLRTLKCSRTKNLKKTLQTLNYMFSSPAS